MSAKIGIDEIDAKILGALIRDARAKLKDIANNCGISSVAVMHRIRRMKKSGVITGSTLFPNLRNLGGVIVASLGIDLEPHKEEEILTLIKKQTNLIEPSEAIGKYDFCALVLAENIVNLEKITQALGNHNGVKRITTNIWISKPAMNFENIDLNPGKPDRHG